MKNIFKIFLTVFISFGIIGGCGDLPTSGFGDLGLAPENHIEGDFVIFCDLDEKQCGGLTSECVPLDTVCCGSGGKVCGNLCINEDLICCDENAKPIFCGQEKPVCCPLLGFPAPNCTESLDMCNCVRPMFSDSYPDVPVCDESVFKSTNISNCFTYEEVLESNCPAELVFKICEPYTCINCTQYDCFESYTYFPQSFTGCEIIDCNTIDCDQAKNIHVDGELSWIEFIDGEESEASCF